MDYFEEFASVPAIVVIVYLCAEAVKILFSGKADKFIPIICGVLGAILAVLAFVVCPGYIIAENAFEAVAIGIVSGFAATGINQVYKQLSQIDEE